MTLQLYSAGPYCGGCQFIKLIMEDAHIDFKEYLIENMGLEAKARLLADLRTSGFPGTKALEAPILRNPDNGKALPPAALRGLLSDILDNIGKIL